MKFPVGCRRLLPVLCIFCLLFSGCGGSAEPGEKHLHTLDGKDFTAVCDVRVYAHASPFRRTVGDLGAGTKDPRRHYCPGG